jgi:hypothetical protein
VVFATALALALAAAGAWSPLRSNLLKRALARNSDPTSSCGGSGTAYSRAPGMRAPTSVATTSALMSLKELMMTGSAV